MILLRSAAYHLLFALWTILCGILFLPLMIAPRLLVQRAAGFWVRGALVLQYIVLGLSYEIRGRENLPTGAAVIASKHQSAWETLVFHALLPDTVFILKKSLLWLPFIGWYLLKTGQVAIDRAAGMKAMGMMAKASRAALARGSQIVIFPEGHRQPPGVAGTYLPGVAMLYGDANGNVPVIPVALNAGLFWPRNAFRRRPGRIVMEILPPMPQGLDRRAFMDELRNRIEGATRALEAEARTRYPERAESGGL
jgi:1-acyl-sn-glycerol-3-phosphate acyltransferase